MHAPVDPDELLPEVLAGGRDELGAPSSGWSCTSGTARPARGLALLRSAVSNEWTAKLLREFLVSQVLRRVVEHPRLPPTSGRPRARWSPRSSSAW